MHLLHLLYSSHIPFSATLPLLSCWMLRLFASFRSCLALADACYMRFPQSSSPSSSYKFIVNSLRFSFLLHIRIRFQYFLQDHSSMMHSNAWMAMDPKQTQSSKKYGKKLCGNVFENDRVMYFAASSIYKQCVFEKRI